MTEFEITEMEIAKFENLKDFIVEINKGFTDQIVFRFLNNYGASVVRGLGTYGGQAGLFELAVIKFNSPNNNDWDINYETEITGNVIGYLTPKEVINLLGDIKNLKGGELKCNSQN